jgi:hypothetical protein
MPLTRLLALVALLAACDRPPEKTDEDGDGVTADLDCDDGDPSVFPGVTENPYDGVDNDCDPATPDDDLDDDGFVHADDCDDENADIAPDAAETPYDGVDNDCDPATPDDDLDGDGFPAALDCGDGNALVNPDAEEVYYDGIDNDCDPLLTVDDDQDRDQVPVDEDCDDLDPLVRKAGTWFVDCDADGLALVDAPSLVACTLPAPDPTCPTGTWTLADPAQGSDCDDADATVGACP